MTSSSSTPSVRVIAFATAEDRNQINSSITSITIEIADAIRIDGVELHRDPHTGERVLRFPAWIDAFGQRHSIVRPTTPEVRRVILQQVLAALDAGIPTHSSERSR